MKKIFASATIAIFFITMPFESFAKTAISESEMDTVTAQAGFTIDFGSGSISIDHFVPSLISYGDLNGFTGYTAAGYIGMSNITMGIESIVVSSLMDMDVGTNAGVTKLKINLPIVALSTLSTDATIKLDTTKTLTDAQPALGTFYNNAFVCYLNANGDGSRGNGSITLSSHTATQGLEIGLDNVVLSVPSVPINLSYGDADGFTGYTGAGYLGLNGLRVTNAAGDAAVPLLTLNGVMQMDVGTNVGGVTAINMVLPTVQVGLINVDASLQLSSTKNFDTQPQLGSLNVVGFTTNVFGGMQISSH